MDSLILDWRLAPHLAALSAADPRAKQRAQAELRALLAQYKTALLPEAEFVVIGADGNTASTYDVEPPQSLFAETAAGDRLKTWRLRYLLRQVAILFMRLGDRLSITA